MNVTLINIKDVCTVDVQDAVEDTFCRTLAGHCEILACQGP